jgi:hypothetical protein
MTRRIDITASEFRIFLLGDSRRRQLSQLMFGVQLVSFWCRIYGMADLNTMPWFDS